MISMMMMTRKNVQQQEQCWYTQCCMCLAIYSKQHIPTAVTLSVIISFTDQLRP